MRVAQELGKRYLWVDSMCIDQFSHVRKAEQISQMSSICGSAFLSIIALARASADEGLPRVNSQTPFYPQTRLSIDGHTLVSAPPSLKTLLCEAVWSTGAWTFQERLLSTRILMFPVIKSTSSVALKKGLSLQSILLLQLHCQCSG